MDADVVMPLNRIKYRVLLASWCWCALALIPLSDAGLSLWWQFVLIPSGTVLAICWFYHEAQPSEFELKGRFSRILWKLLPVVCFGMLLVRTTNLGLAIRVWLCEDELTALAISASGGDEPAPLRHIDSRVGLFYVYSTTGIGNELTMITDRGFCRSYGITYYPSGPPIGTGDEYQHLFGPWYRFVDDF